MLHRRTFLTALGGSIISGSTLAGKTSWKKVARKNQSVQTHNTAKNLIFITLIGAPSHVDTFDLKTGSYTPDILGPENIGGVLWPSGIMPQLGQRLNKFSIVRSITAIEQVHERAVYHLQTAHRPNPALTKEIPNLLAALSHELHDQRKPGDSLPTVMSLGSEVFQGFFDIQHSGISLGESGRIDHREHPFETHDNRFQFLQDLMVLNPPQDANSLVYARLHEQARDIMNDPDLNQILNADTDNQDPNNIFLNKAQLVVRALKAKKGSRIFQVEFGDWDHHGGIYEAGALPDMAAQLDSGLAYMIDELENTPGEAPGKTLFDETLIVAMGEFGRTVGNLNESEGRDHYPYVVPAFFAGGGVKPGRIIGQSDNIGGTITDAGWSHSRYMEVEDVGATICSALGVDWTQNFLDTPSGRVFQMVDSSQKAMYAIDPLFV